MTMPEFRFLPRFRQIIRISLKYALILTISIGFNSCKNQDSQSSHPSTVIFFIDIPAFKEVNCSSPAANHIKSGLGEICKKNNVKEMTYKASGVDLSVLLKDWLFPYGYSTGLALSRLKLSTHFQIQCPQIYSLLNYDLGIQNITEQLFSQKESNQDQDMINSVMIQKPFYHLFCYSEINPNKVNLMSPSPPPPRSPIGLSTYEDAWENFNEQIYFYIKDLESQTDTANIQYVFVSHSKNSELGNIIFSTNFKPNLAYLNDSIPLSLSLESISEMFHQKSYPINLKNWPRSALLYSETINLKNKNTSTLSNYNLNKFFPEVPRSTWKSFFIATKNKPIQYKKDLLCKILPQECSSLWPLSSYSLQWIITQANEAPEGGGPRLTSSWASKNLNSYSLKSLKQALFLFFEESQYPWVTLPIERQRSVAILGVLLLNSDLFL